MKIDASIPLALPAASFSPNGRWGLPVPQAPGAGFGFALGAGRICRAAADFIEGRLADIPRSSFQNTSGWFTPKTVSPPPRTKG